MDIEYVLSLNGLFGNGSKIKVAPRLLILRAATGVDSDRMASLDYGMVDSLFYKVETTWIDVRSLTGITIVRRNNVSRGVCHGNGNSSDI